MRVAQLTDLHLRWHQPGTSRAIQRRCRLMPELLRRALRQGVEAGVDLFVLSGDLLDVPGYLLDHDDYYDYDRPAWERDVEADYRLIRDLLEATGKPYRVLPGNHDLIGVMTRVFPPEPLTLDFGGYRFVSFWDRDFYAHVPRRFDRERILFEQALNDPASPPQVHLQHYVLTPALNQGWPHTYFEGEELTRRVVASGKVVLSLSGHYHPGTDRIDLGGTCFVTGPAFCEFPHRYRLFDLTPGGVAMTDVPLLDRPVEAGRTLIGLDRDGVLNVAPSWRTGPEPLAPVPGVGAALRRLHEAGYATVVLSSQSAAGAGWVTPSVIDSVFDRLARFLWEDGICWDAFCYSTGAGSHAVHPSYESTELAKPNPHYLLQAAKLLQLELAGGAMVGDTHGDLETGVRANLTPILVRTGHGAREEQRLAEGGGLDGVVVVDDIAAAAEWIVGRRGR